MDSDKDNLIIPGQGQNKEHTEHNLGGQKVIEHESVKSVVEALNAGKPDRVLTFTTGGLFGGYRSTVSFVDQSGVAHGYVAEFSDKKGQAKYATPVWNTLDQLNIREADGIIRVDDETGDVYQIFQTEDPDDADKYIGQVGAWQTAVGEVETRGQLGQAVGQYLKLENGQFVVDVTSGKSHLVTDLRPESGYDIDWVKREYPQLKLQDNTPVVRWKNTLTGSK